MTRLKNHRESPPGLFFIKARIVNGAVAIVHGPCSQKDNCFTFGPSPEIGHVARMYGDFLKGNNLPGHDFATTLQLVDEYTCTRIGGSPQWCRNSEKPYTTRSIAASRGGGCCGAKLK